MQPQVSAALPTFDRLGPWEGPTRYAGLRSLAAGAAAALLVVGLSLAASPAFAQSDAPKKQAQALQVEGVRLMQRGDNRAALGKFDEAFRLVASPKILFNRGKAHNALGEPVEALSDFTRFLDEAPYAPQESRAEAERAVQALRPKLSFIEVQTDDVGSRVSIDGKEIGTAPLALPAVVVPGTHEVRLEKPGMTADTRSVSPIAGQKVRVVVKLVPVAETPSAGATPPPGTSGNGTTGTTAAGGTRPLASGGGGGAGPAANPGGIAVRPEDHPPEQPSGSRPWQTTAAWISGGAGIAFLAGGVVAHLLSASKNAEFNDAKVPTTATNPDGRCDQAFDKAGGGPCQGLLDAAHSRLTLAIVGYAAAGAALAGSLIFYLTAPDRSPAEHKVAAGCVPSSAASGLSCAVALRF
jgi:hypothetical protein